MEHIDQSVRIDNRRFLALSLGDLDRQLDEVDIVVLPPRILGTEAPHAVLTGLRLVGALFPIRIPTDHLQPRRTGVVRGEHRALAKMRRQMRPGHFARHGLKHNRMPLARMSGLVLGIVDRALLLAHRTIAVPGPIQHRRVIGNNLTLLIVLVTRLAHRRQLHRDPILHRNDGRVRIPVAFALVGNRELFAEPIDGLTDQLVRRDRSFDPALAIRQLTEIRHHVVPEIPLLDRVVHPPIAPHARHIMVRDVAVKEKVAGQLLTETGTALCLQVKSLGRPDDFDVDPVCLRTNHGILHRPVHGGRPEIHVVDRPRAAWPPDGSTVGMVRVEHFRSTVDQTELGWIADVGTGNRRGGIAERIGAISHRLVFEPEILVLHVHIVDAERLATIVDRAATRTISIGQGITLREEVTFLVQRSERFVTDFVVIEYEFPKVRTSPVLDHNLPAAGGWGCVTAAERFPIGRTAGLDHEGPEHAHHRQLTVLAIGMELADAFLGVRMDVPLELAGLLFFDDGVGVGRRRCRARGAHHHARPMDMQTDRPAALFQLV